MSAFHRAIVKGPGHSLVAGLTSAHLGLPDYQRACHQHRAYTATLVDCGLEVTVLDADEDYPDSVFIEDVAVLLPGCAVITRPAAPSRAGETQAIRPVLASLFPRLKTIEAPGTLDGGDVLMVGDHCFIGLSARTNLEGAAQLIDIAARQQMRGTTVAVHEFLHLKTGVTAVSDTLLLAAGEFIDHPAFAGFTLLPVTPEEAGAANCLRINDTILIPAGYPRISRLLSERGERVVELDISEFAKLDGGLTCLSLRF